MPLRDTLINGYVSEENISIRTEPSPFSSSFPRLNLSILTTTVFTGLTLNAATKDPRLFSRNGFASLLFSDAQQNVRFFANKYTQSQASLINKETRAYELTITTEITATFDNDSGVIYSSTSFDTEITTPASVADVYGIKLNDINSNFYRFRAEGQTITESHLIFGILDKGQRVGFSIYHKNN